MPAFARARMSASMPSTAALNRPRPLSTGERIAPSLSVFTRSMYSSPSCHTWIRSIFALPVLLSTEHLLAMQREVFAHLARIDARQGDPVVLARERRLTEGVELVVRFLQRLAVVGNLDLSDHQQFDLHVHLHA